MIVYRLLVLDRNTWNYITAYTPPPKKQKEKLDDFGFK